MPQPVSKTGRFKPGSDGVPPSYYHNHSPGNLTGRLPVEKASLFVCWKNKQQHGSSNRHGAVMRIRFKAKQRTPSGNGGCTEYKIVSEYPTKNRQQADIYHSLFAWCGFAECFEFIPDKSFTITEV